MAMLLARLAWAVLTDQHVPVSEQGEGAWATSFTVARRFRVWRYSVSHQTLVLRSTARFAGDDLVDAWFDGVAATNLHQGFEPLTVRAAEPDECERIFTWSAADIYDVRRQPPLCLILASSQPDGFVVCAHARIEANRQGVASGGRAEETKPGMPRTLWYAGPTGDPAQRHEYRALDVTQNTET
ncbi:MAG: hypothetical protein HOV87_19470 [Catenulispora sp.]|nr:hypothetical protein [Catenulispora sp.]